MTKKEKNTYIAVAVNDYEKIIAEGNSMQSVIEKADKTGEDYILAPALDGSTTYIFWWQLIIFSQDFVMGFVGHSFQ